MPEKFDFSKTEDQKEFENLPQTEKDKIVGEAQEEAYKISEPFRIAPVDTKAVITEKLVEKDNLDDEKIKLPDIKTEQDKKEVEKIKEKMIDIKDFSGLVHQTFLPNLQHIFRYGFSEKSLKKAKWSHGGGLIQKNTGSDPNYFSVHTSIYMKKKRSLFEPRWAGAGNVAILFDVKKIQKTSERDLSRFLKKEFDGSTVDFGEADDIITLNKTVCGLVSLNHEEEVERRRVQGFRLNMALPPKQSRHNLTNRLSRWFKNRENNKTGIDFVPVYDSFGNMIWPGKMGYEEVQKTVVERDRNKEQNEKTA